MRSLLEPQNLLLIAGSNMAAYLFGGGTIHIKLGRMTIKIGRPTGHS